MAALEVLVVGYGNPLRGDDGVGQEVAQLLARQKGRSPVLAGAEVTWAHQLAPEMAPDLSRADFAVFVDAVCDRRPVGSVTVRRLMAPGPGPGSAAGIPASCWEDLSPEGLLALTLDLYGNAPPAALVTVGVSVTGFGSALSPVVRAAVPRAAAAVRLAIAARTWARPAHRPRAESATGTESGRGRGHNA
jgi:hydrogenase maturation protease